MGQKVSGVVPTLFGGVSRQPQQVRQPNQVQEMDNAFPSVVTGGFEKRPPTRHIAALPQLYLANHKVFGINRSADEQVMVAIRVSTSAPEIQVFDANTGAAKTVVIGDSIREFLVDQDGINNTNTVQVDGADFVEELKFDSGETTFDWTYELSDSSSVFKVQGSSNGVSGWTDIATGKTGSSGSFSTTIDAAATGDHNFIRFVMTTGAGSASDTLSIRATFKDLTYLNNVPAKNLWLTSVADYTFIVNRTVTTRLGPSGSGTINGTEQTFSDLPAASGGGSIYKVIGRDTDGFGSYYVKDSAGSVWQETVDPTGANSFDETSLPHQLVRSADGSTYTFSACTWAGRAAGDEDLNPAPGFIGGVINDIIFYRNRLGFLSDETCYLSQAGDVFNLWAAKATEVLDSDPIERGATTDQVNILQFAKVFRKAMFLTSANAQFELDSGEGRPLTPETADMNQATTYRGSRIAKPAALGDVLYFASEVEDTAIVYEYYFQDSSFSNTATDVTRHIRTYLPSSIDKMTGDPAAQTMVVKSTEYDDRLFVYTTFFDDASKIQSAWSTYKFGDDVKVVGFEVFEGNLHLVLRRGGTASSPHYLEKMSLTRESPSKASVRDTLDNPSAVDMPYTVMLDQREEVTGVYDSGTNLTTFTTTWDNEGDAEVILGPPHDVPGQQLQVSYPTSNTMTATGDWSVGRVFCGRPYTMLVELSRIYIREDNAPILNGRLQLQDVTILVEETGYYKLQVTSDGGRDVKSETYEGKVLGGGAMINDASLQETDAQRHVIHSRGEDTKIEIINDKAAPSVITSLQWRGFWNELSRQG